MFETHLQGLFDLVESGRLAGFGFWYFPPGDSAPGGKWSIQATEEIPPGDGSRGGYVSTNLFGGDPEPLTALLLGRFSRRAESSADVGDGIRGLLDRVVALYATNPAVGRTCFEFGASRLEGGWTAGISSWNIGNDASLRVEPREAAGRNLAAVLVELLNLCEPGGA